MQREKTPRAFLIAGIAGVALSLGIMGLIAYGTAQELK